MAVTGDYLAVMVRVNLVPDLRAFQRCVLEQLLPAFANLDQRAEEVADAEYERLGSAPVGEDCDGDMGGIADSANEAGVAFYQTMSSLRQATLNLFAAGLFHLLEQQLTHLCHDGAVLTPPPRDSKLHIACQWYRDHFGMDLESLVTWATIDELRLVANSAKHGEGGSVRKLREMRSALFVDPVARMYWPDAAPVQRPVVLPLGGDALYVTTEVFEEYASAAIRFLEEIAAFFETHSTEYFPIRGQRYGNRPAHLRT